MLKTLIKKQFMEMFRGFFVNRKNGQAYSKGRSAFNITMFTILMLVIAASVGALASFFAITYLPLNLGWLYYSLLGTLALILGIFGSVFNTYAGLYKAKDNDLLISLPIPPVTIVLSRVAGVYGMALLYSGLVWIPALVVYQIFAGVTVLGLVFGLVLFFLLGALITVLTCILGWIVALASGKLKGKSIVKVLISVVFFLIYYFICFRLSSIMQSLANNAEAVGRAYASWGNVLYWLGKGAEGSVPHFLLFAAVSVVLALICLAVLSKTFLKLTLADTGAYASGKKTELVRTDIDRALFRRELMRFTSSSAYMLNCGLGLFLLPVLAVIVLVKRDSVLQVFFLIAQDMPVLAPILPVLAILIVFMISGLNLISTPSVSLEGKTLWLLKSLPVKPFDVLKAKLRLHERVSFIPVLFSALVLCLAFGTGAADTVLVLVACLLHVMLIARVGLVFGLKRPNFIWTSEITPIKQSLSLLFVMLINFAISIGVPILYLLTGGRLQVTAYLAAVAVVLALIDWLLQRWMRTKGCRIFEEL